MNQPSGFVDSTKPTFVCKLKKALYGLKQAPCAWYLALKSFMLNYGFKNSAFDTSLFYYTQRGYIMYLLVYVDDIVITGSRPSFTQDFIHALSGRLSLKDRGALHYFLGVEVIQSTASLLLLIEMHL